ncbi:MAG: hypothetical protein LBE01_04980 [Deltaproteobacteria bacterium]|jgi:hypothetical protein|nr:hypothetical protein [Deltaproteobacteria bacterium]
MTAAPMAPNKKDLWAETLDACQKCLDLDRRFAAQLERQIAGAELDPLDPALWENFIEARRDLFDFTAMNLKLLAQGRSSPAESLIRERLLDSLSEMAAIEEQLADFLAKGLGDLKEAIDDLANGQALFAGYAALDAKPCAIRLDSQA